MEPVYFIIIRNTRNGGLIAVHSDDEDIATFSTEKEAQEAADQIPICQAYPYQIVCFD